MNDDILKNNSGGIYFDELLERIRDIRSQKKYSGEKCLIFMQQVWTMTPELKSLLYFLRQRKIKCIGQPMDKLQQKRLY